jgi:phage terminase large subunit-like protein
MSSRAEQLATLPESDREAFWSSLTDAERASLEFDWAGMWSRPEQREPAGQWRTWLYLAGRGAGKTRTGAEWIRRNLTGSTPLAPGRYRHACLLAETAKDARDVMVGDGLEPSNPAAGSGILQVCPPDFAPLYEPSKRRLTFPNGAVCTIFNAVEYDSLRGSQFDISWIDELAKFGYQQQAWDMLQFCLRIGKNPRCFVSTTPRPTTLIKSIINDPTTHVTRGSTFDNASNLAPQFLAAIKDKYEGTRLGAQELYGDVIDDVPGALFKRADIESTRVKEHQLPELVRCVIAIDPSASSHEGSDECGISCVALGSDDHLYVLDDASGVMSPNEWARAAVALYRARRADRIVAERNNGGLMVEEVIRGIDSNISYTSVWASRGKVARAEPIASLYEQHKVHHCGVFHQMEDQLCSLTTDFSVREMGFSPDRAEAAIWGLTFLSENMSGGGTRGLFTSVPTYGGVSAPDWYTSRRYT